MDVGKSCTTFTTSIAVLADSSGGHVDENKSISSRRYLKPGCSLKMAILTCIAKRTNVKGTQNHAAQREYLEAASPALRVHSTSVMSVIINVTSGCQEGQYKMRWEYKKDFDKCALQTSAGI